MARKTSLSLENLAALGAEKLAQIILDEAQGNAPFRKKVNAALARAKGAEAVAALIDRRLAALEKARAMAAWEKEKDFAADLAATVETIVKELGQADAGLAVDRLLRFIDIRKSHNMPAIYDHRSHKEMGIEVDAVPSLTRQEFHDVQRGRENPAAASKIEKRWHRALFKAADETKLELPDKVITKRYVDLIAKVTKRAPVSIVAAKAAHGGYLNAIKRINDARLDRIALKIAIERELSALTPEIGSPSATAKGQAAAQSL